MVVHAFTTRQGGVSRGPYRSLNLAFHVGDSPEAVLENRRRACRVLAAGLEDMVCGQQVHGDRVHVVKEADRGRGACDHGSAIPETDALVTCRPGLLLASFYADCVPILILDPVRRAAGLVHAGWKGTAAGIAGAALEAMGRAFGTRPEDCLAAIAPAIGPCCYEVDQPVLAAMAERGFDPARHVYPAGPDRWKLDLPGLNREILTGAGVKEESVSVARLCTSCSPELFFSYRGQSGRCGRMASLIALK
ncbi:MAG: peptidoglycan editing factor PgeF [Peptococcaceae bacterium]|nr:peptidoglycan editing factor PgeF [Peptococcaceae bacterium]